MIRLGVVIMVSVHGVDRGGWHPGCPYFVKLTQISLFQTMWAAELQYMQLLRGLYGGVTDALLYIRSGCNDQDLSRQAAGLQVPNACYAVCATRNGDAC